MVGLSTLLTVSESRAETSGQGVIVALDGAISPATAAYFEASLDAAIEGGASLLILELDTPGGLDSAMRDIIKRILGSPIPVVTYVSPSGSRAASAGTYILYASHIAAMAPATNLGAATPIPVGGSPGGQPDKPAPSDGDAESTDSDSEQAESDRPSEPADAGTASRRKAVNDAVAYIRGLAERRGRNADWAERAVREGVSLSADAALADSVIDLIARDVGDLLKQIDGQTVEVSGGEVTLDTAALTLERVEPDWRIELLSIITNPTVAYILMMIGIYGLLLEGYSPGAIVPGVVGAISLLLALFAFQALPVNYAGLALMALGVALMIAEAFAPSFGALGLGGVAAFVFGSIMLMDADVPGYGVNLGVIGGIAFVGIAGVGLSLWMLMRARHAPVSTAAEALVGETGTADTPLAAGEAGWSVVAGETWKVRPTQSLMAGDRFRVVSREGLELQVEPIHRPG
ncbi:nodulation protein NfeD [uncultured Abyssibacter sp.]|uniref:NfeD family protein n=1 Tax=uncultured Abyssibacter sp. TaxID=2320202 RepID=UPI0032B29937